MRLFSLYLFFFIFLIACQEETENDITIQLEGLIEAVEVFRDDVGINHIYARTQHDLFFAQGYCAAKDRLFQFEIWRRQATGTVAEILGERELKRDIGTRLFKFRGNIKKEMQHYHPDGQEIIAAYTDGVNAYIEEVLQNPDLLPVTFKALDIKPQKWTPEVVISRHQGLLGNINIELLLGRAVVQLGVEKVKKYFWFHPKDPIIDLDPTIKGALSSEDILGLYQAFRAPIIFQPEDIVPIYRLELNANQSSAIIEKFIDREETSLWVGSNNWVTSPSLSENGHTYMANDPHRRLAAPSLRYWVHLSAPGWDVIGGGEPEIPGVSIGHNQYGAWGLTVFRTDGEDLYVYDLNPDDLNQYNYQNAWEDMKIITEWISVKNSDDVEVALRYTRHGPVTYIDSLNLKAYAVRCAWLEPGGSPYLASLRMDQAKSWEEFREACNYSHIPGENMIWADKEGNIGWQAVGIAPVRRNFSGLVPVPGDGRYEWDGYLPIIKKPNSYNPPNGFIVTANENVTPDDYSEWDAIGYTWSDPFRGNRIREVLMSGKKLTMDDMKKLQVDYLSIPARILVPLLEKLKSDNQLVVEVQKQLMSWDFILDKESTGAAIYVTWEKALQENIFGYFPDPEVQAVIPRIQMTKLIEWILNPETIFGTSATRDEYLMETFSAAVKTLIEKFGDNMDDWRYGQTGFKHVQIKHLLSDAVNVKLQAKLNTAIVPRGGNQYTPGATGSSNNQSHGATFKIIVDVNDWDQSVGMNAPGQSGNPESIFYQNLFESWANEEYFPVNFSRSKVELGSRKKVLLIPQK